MKIRLPKRRLFVLALLVVGTAAQAHDDDHLGDPDVQKTLRAMKDTSTWFHPDLFGEFTGLACYAKHQYADAHKYLEIGAYYADKLSQLSLGLMYMNGEGVDKDPATALAWFEVAAERGYPDFVATRDRLKATLTAEQLARSQEIFKTLDARYGDAVAKPRMVVQLRQGQMQTTGSRLGFDAGVNSLDAGKPKGAQVLVGGSSDLYAKNRWDPDSYFKSRDAQWKATVTVGAVEDAASNGAAAGSASQH